MKSHPLHWLTASALLVAASGAHCPQVIQQYVSPAPRVLPQNATLDQIIGVVNANGSQVQSIYASQATVSVAGFPSLRASLAAERTRRFRLRASSIMGDEVDLGSNDELFWIWIRRNQPPSLLFCRHDQFAGSNARQILPVEIEWLFEALGAVTFDPAERHEGPTPLGSGRVQIRSSRTSSLGQLTKLTIIDEARGWVLEQHVYDAQGQRLATSLASRHRRDPLTGATLPQQVEIQWPPARFSMKIEMDDLQTNRLPGDPSALWTMPEYPGYTNIDLADPSIRFNLPQAGLAPPQDSQPADRRSLFSGWRQ